MYLPNYQDGSIVNLMSSIAEIYGYKSQYKPLKLLNSNKLIKAKNIVLLVIDGLGYEYLIKYGKNSYLRRNLCGKITSVFPATTPTVITTFFTGLAPQQHAITGWFMYLKELGSVVAILPYNTRSGGLLFNQAKIRFSQILRSKTFFKKIKVKSYCLFGEEIINSDFNQTTGKGAELVAYKTLNNFFDQLKKILNTSNRRKFIYAYLPWFDYYCHVYGVKSKEAYEHFKEIDKKLNSFTKAVKDTKFIIVSDHGQIDTEKSKIIRLENHPKFLETLTLPLCGESRCAYCYVHPSKIKQFKEYIKNNFSQICEVHKSQDLIQKGYFGLFKPNHKLFDRVGDYILIMKENYIVKDFILGEKKAINIGNHGGMSREEMLVPLILI